MKCENCKKEKEITNIKNYVVKYESWEAYNCCCKDCAKKCANSNGITEDEIIGVE